jgi:uncharacterized membrane protein YhhN
MVLKDKRVIILLVVLAAIYTVILYLDFSSKSPWVTSPLKYAGVCLCFLMAALTYKRAYSRQDAKFLLLGLSFTLVSDALLLFSFVPALGIATFMCAHLCYIKRYKPAAFRFFLIIALIDLLFCLAGVLFALNLPYLFILGGVYALLIIAATVSAFRSNLPKTNKRLACMGMVLFLLCDSNLAINFLAPAGSLLAVSGMLIWLFYIPSQACLALSAGEQI